MIGTPFCLPALGYFLPALGWLFLTKNVVTSVTQRPRYTMTMS